MPHTPPQPALLNLTPRGLNADVIWPAVDSTAGRQERQHQAEALRQGAFPTALAVQLLQCLSALPLPPELQAYATTPAAPPTAEVSAPSRAALQTWIERLLQEKGVMETILRLLQTAQRGSALDTGAPTLATETRAVRHAVPGPATLEALTPDADGATLLDTCTTVLAPVLLTVLEAYIAACSGEGPPTPRPAPTLPQPLADYLHVLSAAHYQAVREVLAQGAFAAVDGLPWPTAQLDKGHARGHAQLRPVVTDVQPYLPPEEIER
jgi:hypothetical protein